MGKKLQGKSAADTGSVGIGRAETGILPSNRILLLILFSISIVVYANTFQHGYVLDDYSVISKNSIVTKGITAIPEILSTPYRRGFYKISNDLYRPLSLVMFSAEYQYSEGKPAISHIINVLIFACCVVLLFIFLDGLFDKKYTLAVFIASVLFALHPIHSEVVANIKSRDELLCFLFAFLCLRQYLKYVQSSKITHLLLGALLFLLSLLSKETTIAFLAVIPLIFFFYRNEHIKRCIYITAISIATAIVYLAIRFSVLQAYSADSAFEMTFIDNALSKPPSAAMGIATAIFILGKYIWLLLIPYPLVCDHSYNSIPFVNFSNPLVLLSLLIYISLLVAGIYLLIGKRKSPLAFAILFFLIMITLFSNIAFPLGSMMGERFVFFSSVGFCLACGLFIVKLANIPRTENNTFLTDKRLMAIMLPVLLVYSVVAIGRNAEWSDGLTLYTADVRKAPDNAKLHFYLGMELLISVESESNVTSKIAIAKEAIDEFRKAIVIYPDYGEAHKSIGNAFFLTSELDSSEAHFVRAIALNPKDVEPINHLDVIYFKTGKFRQSIDLCKKAIALDTTYFEGYNNMGICYMNLKEYDSAIYMIRKSLLHDPANTMSLEVLTTVFKQQGNKDSAIRYEAMAQRQDPAFRVY